MADLNVCVLDTTQVWSAEVGMEFEPRFRDEAGLLNGDGFAMSIMNVLTSQYTASNLQEAVALSITQIR